MYLSSKFIRKMLQKAGFIAEEPILVSGETKLSKWEGTMFADIVQKYKLQQNNKTKYFMLAIIINPIL